MRRSVTTFDAHMTSDEIMYTIEVGGHVTGIFHHCEHQTVLIWAWLTSALVRFTDNVLRRKKNKGTLLWKLKTATFSEQKKSKKRSEETLLLDGRWNSENSDTNDALNLGRQNKENVVQDKKRLLLLGFYFRLPLPKDEVHSSALSYRSHLCLSFCGKCQRVPHQSRWSAGAQPPGTKEHATTRNATTRRAQKDLAAQKLTLWCGRTLADHDKFTLRELGLCAPGTGPGKKRRGRMHRGRRDTALARLQGDPGAPLLINWRTNGILSALV